MATSTATGAPASLTEDVLTPSHGTSEQDSPVPRHLVTVREVGHGLAS